MTPFTKTALLLALTMTSSLSMHDVSARLPPGGGPIIANPFDPPLIEIDILHCEYKSYLDSTRTLHRHLDIGDTCPSVMFDEYLLFKSWVGPSWL